MENWLLAYTVDLAKGDQAVSVLTPNVLALPGDNLAHTWMILVTRNGEPADLTGATATAYFTRGDGNTVMLVGTAEGNVCAYTMLSTCYAVPWPLRCVLKVTSPTIGTVTLLDKIVQVRQGIGGSIIDPGTAIPNLEQLLAAVPAANAAVAAANDAAVYARQSRFTVLGIYATLSALQAEHPTGTPGDAYAVGTAASNVIYVWNVDTSAWASIGGIPVIAGAFIKGIEIPSGADLNNYISPGSYAIMSGGVAAGIVNIPYTGSGGRLEVKITTAEGSTEAASYLFQEHTPHNLAGSGRYIRTLQGANGWSPWYKLDMMEPGYSTLTLLNGYTGWIRYSKTASGLVIARFNITPGTVSSLTQIAVFPAGYRPIVNLPLLLIHGTSYASKNFMLTLNGNLYNIGALEAGGTYSGVIIFMAE